MKNKKSAMYRSFMFSLALVLLCGCLAFGITSAFSRYRTDVVEQIAVGTAIPDTLVVQTWEYNEEEKKVEVKNATAEWMIDGGENILNLAIANANENDEKAFKPQKDIYVSLRAITSIGAVRNGEPIPVKLRVYYDKPIKADENAETVEQKPNYFEVEGVPANIEDNTILHVSFGEGYVYTFDLADEYWKNKLDGSAYSVLYMQIVADCEGIDYPALMRVQAEASLEED